MLSESKYTDSAVWFQKQMILTSRLILMNQSIQHNQGSLIYKWMIWTSRFFLVNQTNI